MKKTLLCIIMLGLLSVINVNAQSEVIIEENFQGWQATEDDNPDDCESGVSHEAHNLRSMDLLTTEGTVSIDVTLWKAAVVPDCDTKWVNRGDATENTPGVTTGFVSLSKLDGGTIDSLENSVDTIGQLIFGPVPHIESIEFGHSETGSNRGIRIYTSTDGETWERPTDDEFWSGDFNSQVGNLVSVDINLSDVYIKFTSGLKDDETSQHSRLHNIKVIGVPGAPLIGQKEITNNPLFVYQVQKNIFRYTGNLKSVKIYNTLGSIMNAELVKDNKTITLKDATDGIYIIKATDVSGKEYIQKIYKK